MRAVILAGGKGSRLRPYTLVLPKPLVPVGDRPILELILRQLASEGFRHVDLCVGHLGQPDPDLLRREGERSRRPDARLPLGGRAARHGRRAAPDRRPGRALPGHERRHPHGPLLRRADARPHGQRRGAHDRHLPARPSGLARRDRARGWPGHRLHREAHHALRGEHGRSTPTARAFSSTSRAGDSTSRTSSRRCWRPARRPHAQFEGPGSTSARRATTSGRSPRSATPPSASWRARLRPGSRRAPRAPPAPPARAAPRRGGDRAEG